MIIEKKPGIYLIFCLANQRAYVGQSNNVKSRLGRHQGDLKAGRHRNEYLQSAYNKYGVDMFVFRPLEYLEDAGVDSLTIREQYWMDQFDSTNSRRGFNLKGAGMCTVYTEAARVKMSESGKKRLPCSDETRAKLSAALTGRPCSEETRRKMSESNKGKKLPPLSEETRAKMSMSRKGRPNKAKGKPLSDETKRKMSESRKGHAVNEETRAKISAARKAWWAGQFTDKDGNVDKNTTDQEAILQLNRIFGSKDE